MEMKFDKIEPADIDLARILWLPDFYNGGYSDSAKGIETVIDEVAKCLDKYVNEI